MESTGAHGLCVEPILRTVLDSEGTLDTLACRGRHATRSVYAVDLLVSPVLVIADSSIELQPRDAAELVGTFASGLRRRALSIDAALDAAIVGLLGLEHEERDARGGELVVARQPLVGLGRAGDGVVECQIGDLRERVDVQAGGVTCHVEEGGDGADGLGGFGCR